MAIYQVKFSPSDVAYNYEVKADDEWDAEKQGRELLVDDMGYNASKAWNCTDVSKCTSDPVINTNKYLYLDDDQDSFTITWGIEDIKLHLEDQEREFDPPLTDEDYRQILNKMKGYHDCNVGINWEVINVYVDSHINSRSQ